VTTVCGIDFTSRPRNSKPITCVEATLTNGVLRYRDIQYLSDFTEFEAKLSAPGPWILGIDFPFGQARRFIENIGWPAAWSGYVDHCAGLSKAEFRRVLEAYKKPRPYGDKEHRRETDKLAGSISPQKLYGTPVPERDLVIATMGFQVDPPRNAPQLLWEALAPLLANPPPQ
jgi:hypothetical protein